MVNFNFFTFVLAVTVVQGAPVSKRIAQVIVDSTAKWEKACVRRVHHEILYII